MPEELIRSYKAVLGESGCHPGVGWYRVFIKLDQDISEVLPYLNVELAPPTDYRHNQEFLLWKCRDKVYAFRPHEIAIAAVSDTEEARKLTADIVETVNSIWKRRGEISPSFEGKKPLPPVLEIYKLLPGSNCKECGYPTCMAFAVELRNDFMKSSLCPHTVANRSITRIIRGQRAGNGQG